MACFRRATADLSRLCKDPCAKIKGEEIEDEQMKTNKSGYFSLSGDSRVLVNC
jgi:hypothetical protein